MKHNRNMNKLTYFFNKKTYSVTYNKHTGEKGR